MNADIICILFFIMLILLCNYKILLTFKQRLVRKKTNAISELLTPPNMMFCFAHIPIVATLC